MAPACKTCRRVGGMRPTPSASNRQRDWRVTLLYPVSGVGGRDGLRARRGRATIGRRFLPSRASGSRGEGGPSTNLKDQLDNCTIKAPGDGLVVYSSSSDRSGLEPIKEGGTVRNQQVLCRLPDIIRILVDLRGIGNLEGREHVREADDRVERRP